jgi:hypothetical protein
MIATELPLDLPQDAPALVAPMLERVVDLTERSRILALYRQLGAMQAVGYEIGTPKRVREATLYVYSLWCIPIKSAAGRCLLSLFINEVPQSYANNKQRSGRAAARRQGVATSRTRTTRR